MARIPAAGEPWMLVLGAAQGAALGLAIYFTMARAPDPVAAASLSSLAQSAGYLVAAAGPLAVGFLRAATGSWTVPVTVLLVICGVEMAVGLFAGRPKMLPAGSVAASSSGHPDADGAHADNYSKLRQMRPGSRRVSLCAPEE